MAWDPTLPQTTTKLRTAPAIFQSNWDAIEQGGVPFDTLQLERQAAAPTRKDTTGWVYSKDPGTGETELYYKDAQNPANEVQISNNGGIGNTSQVVYASNIVFPGSISFTSGSFATAWGNVASSGSANGIFGASVVRSAIGTYTVTFSSPLANANYAVVATIADNLNKFLNTSSYTTTSFVVRTKRLDNENLENNPFSFIVFGGS